MSEKTSSTIKGIKPRTIDQMRFWSRVIKGQEGCWLWGGAVQKGYGVFTMFRKNFRAHRLAFYFTAGSIPDGALVCHKCDTPNCVNPEHLFLGTAQDNMSDAITKDRTASGERCARSKLTKDDVTLIRKLREQGVTMQQIANRFEVTKQSVWAICNGVTWRHR